MSTRDLLKSLEASGATFRAEGDRLRVNAPRGVLTPEVLATLAARKAELLAILRDGTAAGPCACLACRPDLWPNGYAEVVGTWPRRAQAVFQEGTRAREAAGLDRDDARRLAYDETLSDLRRVKR